MPALGRPAIREVENQPPDLHLQPAKTFSGLQMREPGEDTAPLRSEDALRQPLFLFERVNIHSTAAFISRLRVPPACNCARERELGFAYSGKFTIVIMF